MATYYCRPYKAFVKTEKPDIMAYLDDLLNPEDLMSNDINDKNFTITRNHEDLAPEQLAAYESAVKTFLNKVQSTYWNICGQSPTYCYNTFQIPKRNGESRTINSPNDKMRKYQEKLLKHFAKLAKDCDCCWHHTNVYAYVKKRGCKDAIFKHQCNDSHYFLKLDFHKFFDNITPDFASRMIRQVFPFNLIQRNLYYDDFDILKSAIEYCFLKNGLPQGALTSPMLTNLIMLPFDYMMSNGLKNVFDEDKYVYTRYADDILISSQKPFSYSKVIKYVNKVLEDIEAPFQLNEEKTRYGSRAGRNWNLGIMLNKDNDITVGHEAINQYKASATNYLLDKKNGHPWDKKREDRFLGLRSYYYSIQYSRIREIDEHLVEKFEYNPFS